MFFPHFYEFQASWLVANVSSEQYAAFLLFPFEWVMYPSEVPYLVKIQQNVVLIAVIWCDRTAFRYFRYGEKIKHITGVICPFVTLWKIPYMLVRSKILYC